MANKSQLARKMMEIQDIQTKMKGNTSRALNVKETAKIIDSITESITELIVKDGKVQIIDFGTFEKRSRAKRMGLNPQTGEKVEIPETIVPAFKAGKSLKEAVKPKKKKARRKGNK